MKVNPIVTQAEFEHDMKDILRHGVIKAMAEYLGVSQTLLVQQFNPDDERISWMFRALSVQIALDAIDPKAGEQLFDLYTLYRLRGMGKTSEEIAAETTLELAGMSGRVATLKASQEVQ